MTVLDANVLIATVDTTDSHYERASLLLSTVSERFVNPVNRAEALVRWAEEDRLQEGDDLLDDLGVETVPFEPFAHQALARLRARTGLRLPDCAVLMTAFQTDMRLATFDDRLAAAARSLGVAVVGAD